MPTVENLRNGLISSSSFDKEVVQLTEEQRQMLEMSEEDIRAGRLISQDAVNEEILIG